MMGVNACRGEHGCVTAICDICDAGSEGRASVGRGALRSEGGKSCLIQECSTRVAQCVDALGKTFSTRTDQLIEEWEGGSLQR